MSIRYKVEKGGKLYTTMEVCAEFCEPESKPGDLSFEHQLALCMNINKVNRNYELCEVPNIFKTHENLLA